MPIIFHLNISWFWKRGIPEAALLRDQFVCAFSLASGKISQGNQLSSANHWSQPWLTIPEAGWWGGCSSELCSRLTEESRTEWGSREGLFPGQGKGLAGRSVQHPASSKGGESSCLGHVCASETSELLLGKIPLARQWAEQKNTSPVPRTLNDPWWYGDRKRVHPGSQRTG